MKINWHRTMRIDLPCRYLNSAWQKYKFLIHTGIKKVMNKSINLSHNLNKATTITKYVSIIVAFVMIICY